MYEIYEATRVFRDPLNIIKVSLKLEENISRGSSENAISYQ